MICETRRPQLCASLSRSFPFLHIRWSLGFDGAAASEVEQGVMVQPPRPAPDSDDLIRLERCQQRLGYHFRDLQLLEAALTHASGADHRLSSNERLEFLGDAVLGLVVCEQLFNQLPHQL